MTKRIQVVSVVAAVGIALILGAAWAQKQAGGPKIPKPPPTAFMSNFYTRTISGKVTRLDGTPAANIPVHARFRRNMTGAEGENKDVTDAQGRYAMRVSAEEFVVMVDNGGTSYLSESHLADVRTKSATDINLTLHLTPRVTVRVRDALTGQPLVGVKITRSGGMKGKTDKNGTFTFRMLGFEEHLELRPKDSRISAAPGYSFEPQFRVRSLDSRAVSDSHALEPDKNVTQDVWTYRNEPGAEQTTFRGIVTGPDGQPVAGARVSMKRLYAKKITTTSDSAGRWSFPTTRILDYEAQQRAVIISAFKDALAGLAFPTAEETWTQIPVRLRPNATALLTSIAVDARGHPIAFVLATLNETFFPVSKSSVYAGQQTLYTDASGHFTFESLWPEGTYTIGLGGQTNRRLPSPAYGYVRMPKNAKYTSNGFHLHPGERRDLGKVVLPLADGFVSGRVVDKQGKPVGGLTIDVAGATSPSAAMTTDADGRFRVERLIDEPLKLGVYRTPRYGGILGEGSSDLYLMQPVKAGQSDLNLVIGELLNKPAKPSAKP